MALEAYVVLDALMLSGRWCLCGPVAVLSVWLCPRVHHIERVVVARLLHLWIVS